MSVALRVRGKDPDAAGAVRLDTGTMAELGLETGDAVAVRGEDSTIAAAGKPFDGEAELWAGGDVLKAAGLAVGDTAAVSTAAARPATAVTLAPPRAFRFEGITDTLKGSLEGRTVTRGDDVRQRLFGGSLEVRFVVVDVVPPGPAVVTAATEVTVRDEPAEPGELSGGPERSYEEVGGLDDAVETLRQLVELPLEGGADLADRPPNGVLLRGPSGSGKTLLADAVGAETDARYVRVPHVDALEDGFDGLAVEAVRDAPAVVLLDDLDRMAPDRGSGGAAAEVGAFMDAVDGDDVAVVATTAHPDRVDDSLRRGGRFAHEIEIGVPDREQRLAILEIHLADVAVDGVDPGDVADRTHGFVGADLRLLVEEAVRHAVDRAGSDAAAVTPADVEAAMDAVTPSGMRGLRIERPDVTYADIGGLEAAKREVIRSVEWPLRYPELLERVSTAAAPGILLHGLPGTGKTMLARAVANATDANFIAVEGPELLNRYVGESERAVREVFERAARNAPSVLFFDEIDALAPERGGDTDAEVTERVVSQLLTELDGVEPREGVVVIGATNRPDVIDPALLRPGRLERVVEVPMPDRDAREEIFRTHARDVPTADVDFGELADATEGYSGSDIEAAVREAGLLAVEDHLREADDSGTVDPESIYVGAAHFDRALDVVAPSVSEEMRRRYDDLVEEVP